MQSRDRRMLRQARWLAAAVALTAVFLGAATSARAEVLAYGEPAFTKTTTNSWFFHWNRVQGTTNEYFICFTLRRNGIVIEPSNGTNGPGSQNCTGNLYSVGASGETGAIQPDAADLPMTVGASYEMCATDFRSSAVIYQSASSACQTTTIDNTKPGISTFVNGTDTYTRNLTIQMHIDYADTIAWPFPANFGCLALGGGCTVDPATQYIAGCSVPNVPLGNYTFSKNNSFDCSTTLDPSTPDGVVAFCARAADQAIPDNPSSSNQSGNATSANISDPQCGSVILDRTPPGVSITASATSVKVGELVNFSAQSSDATSGTNGQYTWVFGVNTSNGAGANASHTYTQAGTYEVKLTTSDGAGNAGEAKKVITVNPPQTGGGTGGEGGTITPPPTNNGISNEAGGGGTQTTMISGLQVVAPKRFKLRKGHRNLPMAFTSSGPGTVEVTLTRRGKAVARGGATFTRAGRVGFKLKLPAKLKPGSYKLKIRFKPKGSSQASTKTLKIRFVAAARGSAVRAAAHSRILAR
jgi:PKD repeat protein